MSALTDQLRPSLLTVTRNAPDWESAQERDELIAAVAALHPAPTTAQQPPLFERAAQLVPLATQLVALRRSEAPTPHSARLHTFVSELSQMVQEAGGLRTSARDVARLLVGAELGAEAELRPVWALLMLTPVALVGWLLHAPIFWVVWRLAHRLAGHAAAGDAR